MPIGIVTDAEMERELGKISKAEIKEIERGRPEGKREVPESLRKVIGETAVESGNKGAQELARQFDISDSSVSAYKHGSTSTARYNEPDRELKEYVDESRSKISGAAKNTLLAALRSLTHDKLGDVKPRDLAGIAKDMSAIVKNIEPTPTEDRSGVQFVFFTPRLKKEENYDIIDVSG